MIINDASFGVLHDLLLIRDSNYTTHCQNVTTKNVITFSQETIANQESTGIYLIIS